MRIIYYINIACGAFIIAIFASIINGCQNRMYNDIPLYPPSSFRIDNLIGVWAYDDISASEIISIKNDGTFVQTIKNKALNTKVYRYGRWQIENQPSGCLYIRMSGMQYIHMAGGLEDGEVRKKVQYSFWDQCQLQTIRIDDTIPLIITSAPNALNGIILIFPQVSRESGPAMLVQQSAPYPKP